MRKIFQVSSKWEKPNQYDSVPAYLFGDCWKTEKVLSTSRDDHIRFTEDALGLILNRPFTRKGVAKEFGISRISLSRILKSIEGTTE
jgi:AraC-like DNA-binding protein